MQKLRDFINNNPNIREEIVWSNFNAYPDAVQCVLTSSAGRSDIQSILEDTACLESISSQLPEYSRAIKLILNSPVFDLTKERGGQANRIEILKSSPLIKVINDSYPVFESFFLNILLFFPNRDWEVFKNPNHIFWKNVKTYEMEALLVMNSTLLPMDKFILLQSDTALLNLRNNQAAACWLLLQKNAGVDMEVLQSSLCNINQASGHYLELKTRKEMLEKRWSDCKKALYKFTPMYLAICIPTVAIHFVFSRLAIQVIKKIDTTTVPWVYRSPVFRSLFFCTSALAISNAFLRFSLGVFLDYQKFIGKPLNHTLKDLLILEASQKEEIEVISRLIKYFSFNKELIEGLKVYLQSKEDPCFSPGYDVHLIELLPLLSWDPEAKERYLREKNRSSELDKINAKLPALPSELVRNIAGCYFFSPPARTSIEVTSETHMTP